MGNYMKLFFAISIFLFSYSYSMGQQDTLRGNYSDGKPKYIYIYPKLDGKYNGLCKRWHPNGQIWSKGIWVDGKQEGLHFVYFENGKIQMKTWYLNGEISKVKSYYSNGNKMLFNKSRKKSSKKIMWYENGKKLTKEKHLNGKPINCSESISLNNKDQNINQETCFCGNTPVFLKDSVYVDSTGTPVNLNYKKIIIQWHQTGKIKSKIKFHKNKGVSKEWDENGVIINEEQI